MNWENHDSQQSAKSGDMPLAKPKMELAQMARPFIVGAPGAGGVLLSQLLAEWTNITFVHNTRFLTRFFGVDRTNLSAAFAAITTTDLWPHLGLSEADLLRSLGSERTVTGRHAARCLYDLVGKKHRTRQVGDETPWYAFSIRHINKLLPEARFVHVIRRGDDIKGRDQRFPQRPAPIHGSETHDEVWRDLVIECQRQSSSVRHYLEVRYEDLRFHTEDSLAEISTFLHCEPVS